MNPETEQKIANKRFQELFETLSARHKPGKAQLEPARLECIGLIIVKFQRLESTLLSFILAAGENPEYEMKMPPTSPAITVGKQHY